MDSPPRRRLHSAIGGNDAHRGVVRSGAQRGPGPRAGRTRSRSGRGSGAPVRSTYCPPERIDAAAAPEPDPDELDAALEQTIAGGASGRSRSRSASRDEPGAQRSALTLKALTYAPTGASSRRRPRRCPRRSAATRNWDYRYAWVRDSSFSSRAFAELGCGTEADAFRAFIMRSAAGHADDLQVLYGVGGERRLAARWLDAARGIPRLGPGPVGNDAAGQLPARRLRRARQPHLALAPARPLAQRRRLALPRLADRPRGGALHRARPGHLGVAGKARALRPLEGPLLGGARPRHSARRRVHAPRARPPLAQVRDELREAIERTATTASAVCSFRRSVDPSSTPRCCCCRPSSSSTGPTSGCSGRSPPSARSSAPATGCSTATAATTACGDEEGAFLCCSFWLVECLARDGELEDARAVFDQRRRPANDLGLFSEEVDPRTRRARSATSPRGSRIWRTSTPPWRWREAPRTRAVSGCATAAGSRIRAGRSHGSDRKERVHESDRRRLPAGAPRDLGREADLRLSRATASTGSWARSALEQRPRPRVHPGPPRGDGGVHGLRAREVHRRGGRLHGDLGPGRDPPAERALRRQARSPAGGRDRRPAGPRRPRRQLPAGGRPAPVQGCRARVRADGDRARRRSAIWSTARCRIALGRAHGHRDHHPQRPAGGRRRRAAAAQARHGPLRPGLSAAASHPRATPTSTAPPRS